METYLGTTQEVTINSGDSTCDFRNKTEISLICIDLNNTFSSTTSLQNARLFASNAKLSQVGCRYQKKPEKGGGRKAARVYLSTPQVSSPTPSQTSFILPDFLQLTKQTRAPGSCLLNPPLPCVKVLLPC
ncbi:hypothetical protein ElyMa_006938300 [Elysia marginata]|uniref:Uncharacterized protein n=1 Tax=Elysia marginata TaxID=1093978 RepID=A0AAV4JHY5_9GAST|nr:hypothetical protein ElyMa_006938300 [Elysia marginata]